MCSSARPGTSVSATRHQMPYQKAPSPWRGLPSLAASPPITQGRDSAFRLHDRNQ